MDDLPPGVSTLREEGELPWSAAGSALKKLLQPLIEGAVIERRRSGGGERLVITDRTGFERWVANRFPGAGGASTDSVLNRARGLVARRDTKRGNTLVSKTPLLMRACTAAPLEVQVDGQSLNVSALTRVAGAAVVMLGEDTKLKLPHMTAVVENLECFVHFEDILPHCPLALLSGGRPSDRLIATLVRSLSGEAQILHLPDYDPVGLDDYLRLHAALGDRVRLFVAEDLERRFQRLGNVALLRDKPRNQELLLSLAARSLPDAESLRVFELITRQGAGLEQEALFVSFS